MCYELIEEVLGDLLRGYWIWAERKCVIKGGERTIRSGVVALDLESAPFKDNDLLTNERILAIAIAKRIGGELASSEGVEVKSLLLEDDSDSSEYELLEQFNEWLVSEPLIVTGYGIRDYDVPLLSIKMKRYDPDIRENKLRLPFLRKLWHIINLLERAVHLDLMTRIRFEFDIPRGLGFDKVLDYYFPDLPLKRVKRQEPLEKGMTKGEHSYYIWKNEPKKLKELVESHAHDSLLITEYMLFEYLPKKRRIMG